MQASTEDEALSENNPVTNHHHTQKLAAICVDDDPYVLQMLDIQLKQLLQDRNILLELMTNPCDVLNQIEQLQIQGYKIVFLLTDYRMPQMTGYELIYAVKTKYQDIDCLLLSGQADKFEVRELIHLELIKSYITKPWRLQDLQAALNKIVIF